MTEWADISKALAAPFDVRELKWRAEGKPYQDSKTQEWKTLAVVYVDARVVQDRLDEALGPGNWQNHYAAGPNGGVLAGISVRIDGEWITKWDGGENTNFSAVKGGLSDAFKRAAVCWGVGRYLYRSKRQFVKCSVYTDKGGKPVVSKLLETPRFEMEAFYIEDAEDEPEPPQTKPSAGMKDETGDRPAANGKHLPPMIYDRRAAADALLAHYGKRFARRVIETALDKIDATDQTTEQMIEAFKRNVAEADAKRMAEELGGELHDPKAAA